MDSNYPFDAASKKLEIEAIAQRNGAHRERYLCSFMNEGIAPKAYIHFDQTHFRYNLMKAQGGESLRQDEENPPEELILRLTGVIGSSSLPPVYELPKDFKSLKKLRQAVTMTGLDTKTFEAALESIGLIHGMFFKEVNTESQVFTRWAPGLHRAWPSVTIGNNYFSTGRTALDLPSVEFDCLVDPYRLLASINSERYHHTTENSVGYYRKLPKVGKEGFKYAKISPNTFAVGDIVEARIAFMAVPTFPLVKGASEPHFKLALILRSLALIDDSFSKEAARLKAQALIRKLPGKKRSIADFSDDEEEE